MALPDFKIEPPLRRLCRRPGRVLLGEQRQLREQG